MTKKNNTRQPFGSTLEVHELVRLRALATITGRPIYSLLSDALAELVEAHPPEIREAVEDCAKLSEHRRGESA